MDIKTPECLMNEYHFVRLLGEGASGKTYLAMRRIDEHPVAVKVLKIDSTFKSMELFEREAKTLSGIKVQGVPRYFGYVQSRDIAGEAYMIQEYVDYPSLQVYLDKGYIFKAREVLTIIRNIARILKHLQQDYVPPIIHRDIKPSNILYNAKESKCVLIDFGAVANPQRKSMGSTVAGTQGYMAPEQLMGDCTIQSDFYALGATSVHLLTGKSPADMDHAPDDAFKLEFEKYLPPDIPENLLNLLRRLLEPRCENRPKDSEELFWEIEAMFGITRKKSINSEIAEFESGQGISGTVAFTMISLLAWIALPFIAVTQFKVFSFDPIYLYIILKAVVYFFLSMNIVKLYSFSRMEDNRALIKCKKISLALVSGILILFVMCMSTIGIYLNVHPLMPSSVMGNIGFEIMSGMFLTGFSLFLCCNAFHEKIRTNVINSLILNFFTIHAFWFVLSHISSKSFAVQIISVVLMIFIYGAVFFDHLFKKVYCGYANNKIGMNGFGILNIMGYSVITLSYFFMASEHASGFAAKMPIPISIIGGMVLLYLLYENFHIRNIIGEDNDEDMSGTAKSICVIDSFNVRNEVYYLCYYQVKTGICHFFILKHSDIYYNGNEIRGCIFAGNNYVNIIDPGYKVDKTHLRVSKPKPISYY